MLRVTLMRHAQTACSAKDVLCGGACNTGLTDKGRQMAHAIAESFHEVPWRAIYSSPLNRALETANPLSERCGVPIITDRRFTEISYGTWDGQSSTELERITGFRSFRQDAVQYCAPGGETASQVAMRMQAGLDDLRAEFDTGEVLLMSHKTSLRILGCTLLGIPLAEYRRRLHLPLTSGAVFEFQRAGPILVRYGGLDHLPDELHQHAGD